MYALQGILGLIRESENRVKSCEIKDPSSSNYMKLCVIWCPHSRYYVEICTMTEKFMLSGVLEINIFWKSFDKLTRFWYRTYLQNDSFWRHTLLYCKNPGTNPVNFEEKRAFWKSVLQGMIKLKKVKHIVFHFKYIILNGKVSNTW